MVVLVSEVSLAIGNFLSAARRLGSGLGPPDHAGWLA
jgi:hypothetical protein